jgi:ferredoxin
MLIGDCASDPPLGATQRTLAAARADDVVYGLGAVALARGHRQLALAVADEKARAALAEAIARIGADVAIVDVADAWPAVAAGERDEVLPASALVAVAEVARASGAARASGDAIVSVVGAVATPAVMACAATATMAELVARAGGAVDDDWLPIAGGAPAGRLVARDATLAEAGLPSVLLVLPAGHAWVRRLRTTVGDWLWRAASACEGCRACSDACPASLQSHALVATLATARDDGTAPAAFAACTGCGVCDAACPAALSPRALAVDVRDRLARGGVATTPPVTLRPGIDRALLTLRLGLGMYDRAPLLTFA